MLLRRPIPGFLASRFPLPFALRAKLPVALLASSTLGLNAGLAALPAQTAPAAGNTLALHGSVVDSVTGRPIARALVTSADRRLATMTDNDGQFSFRLLLEGGGLAGADGPLRLRLTATRPGFFAPETPLSVVLNAADTNVTLKLLPAGTISGQIRPDDAGTAQGVQILLLNRVTNDGVRRWMPSGTRTVGADGRYSFGNLHAGDYTLLTLAWPGRDPLPPVHDRSTRQYPTTFLGHVNSLPEASVLKLRPGDQAQADLRLTLTDFHPVIIPITGVEGGVQAQVGEFWLSGLGLLYDPKLHALTGALPNGDYPVAIRSNSGEGAAAQTEIHVGGTPVHTAPVFLAPPAPITVRVHREFTGKEQPSNLSLRVYLQPDNFFGPFITAATKNGLEDDLVLAGALPGQYLFRTESSAGYPAAIRCGGTDLLAVPLLIPNGGLSCPLDLTLRDDDARIFGAINGPEGVSLDGWFVALLPTNLVAQIPIATVSPEGKFVMEHVPPGTYRLIPTRKQPWHLPWRDPEAMQSLAGRLTTVTVSAGQELHLELPLPAGDEPEEP